MLTETAFLFPNWRWGLEFAFQDFGKEFFLRRRRKARRLKKKDLPANRQAKHPKNANLPENKTIELP